MRGTGIKRRLADAVSWLRNLPHRPALLTILANNGSTLSYTLTSLVSVPLALHYMSRTEFGLWAFTTQSIGYFLLLDLGVSVAISRLLAEPLAHGDSVTANQWLTFSTLVMAVQAAAIGLAGWLLVNSVLVWFGIPADLMAQARSLWLWMICLTVVQYLTRIIGGILYAQNRFYWNGFGMTAAAWFGLAGFVFFLRQGCGVMAYAYSAAMQTVCGALISWLGVFLGADRFRLDFRNAGLARLRKLYGFSGGIFLTQIAVLVLVSGQTLIVTKMLGLVTAGGYNVCAKVILTVRGVLWKLFESFLPGWQRLYVKNQIQDLLRQWRLRFDLVMSTAFAASAVFIAVNHWFVDVWARPDMYQGFGFDLAAAAFCLVSTVSSGFSFPQLFAMRVWGRSFWHLVGAAISVGLGIVLVRYTGTAGVFWAGTIAYLVTMIWFNVYLFWDILWRRGGQRRPRTPWKCFRSLGGFVAAIFVIMIFRSSSVETRLIVAGLIVAGVLGLFFWDWKSALFNLFAGRSIPEGAVDSPTFKV